MVDSINLLILRGMVAHGIIEQRFDGRDWYYHISDEYNDALLEAERTEES